MTTPDIDALVGRLTLEEKVRLLTGRDSWSLHPLPGIGLRSIVMSDGPVGVRGAEWDERSPSVNLPSPTAVAASWDPAVAEEVGRALGTEAVRKGVDVVLAPTINLHRTPYGGRHFEAFSEDPLLTARMSAAYVRGVQSQGVAATVKHYVANDSETERFTVDVRVDDRTLRELYLAAFEAPVTEAGAWVVMSAYNSVNGRTASENALLTTPLTDEWAFDGVVVSDWTAVRSIEAAAHPQDLAMPGPVSPWSGGLLEAVRDGRIPEAAVDRKVRRILRLAERVGALEGTRPHRSAPPAASPAGTAREAAEAGAVLLRNDGVLPLQSPRAIAVIGEGAVLPRTQGGGSATVIPPSVSTPLAALRERWPDAEITWAHGAVVGTAPRDLPVGSFTTPAGEPGMEVRIIAGDGRELRREHRAASGIVSFDAQDLIAQAAEVEFTFTYRPDPTAPRALAISGVSDFTVRIDGAAWREGAIRTRPDDDPATALLTPPFDAVPLPESGDAFDVAVRFRPVAGGMPDALALRVGVLPRTTPAEELRAEAVRAAAASEVAVVVVSTSPEDESEGFDRTTLALPGAQADLVRAVIAANPRTVVVVNAGAPVILPTEGAAAILAMWFPGQEFGTALARILSGDAEPGGRLPTTWPAREEDIPVTAVTPVDGRLEYAEGLHIGHRAWLRDSRTPAFAFGHGLGYTSWEVETVCAAATVGSGEDLTVSARVRNTGGRTGKTVVQVYIERVGPSTVDRPRLWLAGFAPAVVAAGADATVTVPVPWRAFAHWQGGWRQEPGAFRISARLASDADGPSIEVVVAG